MLFRDPPLASDTFVDQGFAVSIEGCDLTLQISQNFDVLLFSYHKLSD